MIEYMKKMSSALLERIPELKYKFPKFMEDISITTTKDFFSNIDTYTKSMITLCPGSMFISRDAAYMLRQDGEYHTEIQSMTECGLIEWFVDRVFKYGRDKEGYKLLKYLESNFQYWDNFLTIYYR